MFILLVAAEGLNWTEKVQVHPPAWLFISLLILLGGLAVVRIHYGALLAQTLESSISFQVAARNFKDSSGLQKQLDLILYVFYIFTAAILLFVAEMRFGLAPYGLSGGLLYLFNLALLGALFLTRMVLIHAAGFLFNKSSIYREYLYNILIFNKLMGILLLPLLLFVVYTDGILMVVFQWIALALVSVLLLMRMIRGFVFSFRKGISIFYMFLYLCALEMAPLLLLYRWLEGIL